MKRFFVLAFLAFFISIAFTRTASAQNDPKLVQVSGLVITSDSLVGIPYATVLIKGTNRGTITNYQGFFSLVAALGDTLQFSSIGFTNASYTIPDTIHKDRFSVVQLLTGSTGYIDTVVIFPWPTPDQFRDAFLSLNVTNNDMEIAKRNLDQQRLQQISETLPYDGNENSDIYLRNEAYKYYYQGQIPPMNIFNPISWAKFIQAWKNGDFKKKK